MSLKGIAIYKNVVKEDDDEMTKVLSEDVVRSCLEQGWCIIETKRHYLELVMTVMSSENCFGNIGAMHSYLMVTL